MNINRDDITHHVLRMTDYGQVSRSPLVTSSCGRTAVDWDVNVDGRPAPHSVYWALTTLQRLGLVMWWDLGIGIHLATITPRGRTQLLAWDSELLGPPPVSTRPLAGLDTATLDAEAARLISTVNFPEDQP